MGITYADHLIDIGYNDITPEQEREIWAREECARRGIDPDANCADGGIDAWMIVAKEGLGFPPCDEADDALNDMAADTEAWLEEDFAREAWEEDQ